MTSKILKIIKKNNINYNPKTQLSQQTQAILPNADKTQSTEPSINSSLNYDITISGPFKIYLQSIENQSKKIDAIKVAKMLVPKYLEKEAFVEIKQLSCNKVCIIVKYRRVDNDILKLPEWKEHGLRAFIPNHLLTKQGIIKGIPTYITKDVLMQYLE